MAAGPEDQVPFFAIEVEHPAPLLVVVRVFGEIDALTAPELREAIGRQSALEARPLILDLAGVSFIGSPALAVLIDANKHHPDLRVVCANRNILRIFEVAGLRSWMRVSPSLPAALADQPQPTEEPEPL